MLDQKARFVPIGITAEFLGDIQQDELAVSVLRRRSLAVPKLSGNASCSLRDAYKSNKNSSVPSSTDRPNYQRLAINAITRC